MKEWLLKEEKNPVGRPRLADEKVLKNAKILIAVSLFLIFFLCFWFLSVIDGSTPINYAKKIVSSKLQGVFENKNGFIAKEYYDDSNYVIEFKITDKVYGYSGSYEVTIYELDGKSWKEKDVKTFDNKTRNFKVRVDSLKNENKTYRVKFQIKNASKIDEPYAPFGWSFVNASKNADKYAYKTFTVKGYYSPVLKEEIDEANKSKNKVTISTNKNDPRCFNVSLTTGTFKINVKYTDEQGKKVLLSNDKEVTGEKTYCIPNQKTLSNVTFKIYGENIKKLMLSNWEYTGTYITNTYLLKPEAAYKN